MEKNKNKVVYSVVVPVYNEEGNVAKLNSEIQTVMKKIGKNFEVIYVNDQSKDNTVKELKSLKNVKVITLNRNYGQATALNVGFQASKGKYIISLDGDGQNNPNDIPKLINKMVIEELDVVCGWRKKRADKGGIRVLTRIGRLMRKLFIKDNVHDTGCTLRIYKAEAAKSLDIQGEMHRYILALLKWKGFKIGEVIVNDRKREHGKSKYGYSKAFRGFFDLVYIWFIDKYSQRPLHLFGYMSLISFLAGLSATIGTIIKKIYFQVDVSDNAWFLVGAMLLGLSFFCFVFGMIFDMLIKIQLNTSPSEKRYHIREITQQ
jgi:glycosyltransferase involved in cell wall biosynthesis